MEDDFVIKEEVKEEDKVSNLNSDSIPEYSPLKFSGMVQEGPTPTSGSGSNTSKHLQIKSQISGQKPSIPIANMKRTKSEFVSRDMRKTHAKDMAGPNSKP